jgi:hypothetical protein
VPLYYIVRNWFVFEVRKVLCLCIKVGMTTSSFGHTHMPPPFCHHKKSEPFSCVASSLYLRRVLICCLVRDLRIPNSDFEGRAFFSCRLSCSVTKSTYFWRIRHIPCLGIIGRKSDSITTNFLFCVCRV